MKHKLAPLALFSAFQRVNDETREVEGYCFMNEDVGEGANRTRSLLPRRGCC